LAHEKLARRHAFRRGMLRQEGSIVIIRGLPVLYCGKCPEYLLEDCVMARVEPLLQLVREGTKLEIVHLAA
jgi:hypothetical protein